MWDELEKVVRSRMGKGDGVEGEVGVRVEGWEVPVEVWPAEGLVVETASTETGRVDGVQVQELEKAEERQVEDKKETYPSVDAEREHQHFIATTLNPSSPTAIPDSAHTPTPAANYFPDALYTTPQDYRGNPNPSDVYDAPGVPGTIEISKRLRIVPALVEGRDVDLDTPTPSQKG